MFFCCCTLKMPIRQFIAFKSYRCWNQNEVDLYFCSFSICPSQLILLTNQSSKFTAQPYCAYPENSVNTWVWKIIQNIDITWWVRGWIPTCHFSYSLHFINSYLGAKHRIYQTVCCSIVVWVFLVQYLTIKGCECMSVLQVYMCLQWAVVVLEELRGKGGTNKKALSSQV